MFNILKELEKNYIGKDLALLTKAHDYAKKAQQFRTECSKSNTSGTSKSKSVSSTKKAGNNTRSHTTQSKGRRK